MNDNSQRIVELDIDSILPNRLNPRIQFNEDEILELSDSIKLYGVLQPITVRPIGDRYEIILGERRYKASVLAGKDTIPAIIKEYTDKESAEIALTENIQRKDLNPIEEAVFYKKILDMGGTKQEELAQRLGKSQPYISNKKRLLELSDEVQEALLDGKISEKHARSLLRLKYKQDQKDLLELIIKKRMTVRQTDEEINKILNGEKVDNNDIKDEVIKKGDNDMNNINENVQVNPSFDIFGGANVNPTPTVNPSFDIFGGQQPAVETPNFGMPQVKQPMVNPTLDFMAQQPIAPEMPQPIVETPSFGMPQVEQPMVNPTLDFMAQQPIAPVIPTPVVETPSFGMPQVEQSVEPIVEQPMVNPALDFMAQQPISPVNPTPVVETPNFGMPQVEQSMVNPTLDFMAQPNSPEMPQPVTPIEVPVSQSPFELPVANQPMATSSIPMTAPIIEDNEPSTIAEVKATTPDFSSPIIVTDYSKQYDPVMPQTSQEPVKTIDLKDVINMLRDCTNSIESSGFKIDVEEYDLADSYQVVIKIDK